LALVVEPEGHEVRGPPRHPKPEVHMSRTRRFAYLFLGLLAVAVVVPAPSEAAQQMACSRTYTGRVCGTVVVVGDSEKPCIERDGKAYCPIFSTFYPATTA
jgi:hypothetical protein